MKCILQTGSGLASRSSSCPKDRMGEKGRGKATMHIPGTKEENCPHRADLGVGHGLSLLTSDLLWAAHMAHSLHLSKRN